MKINIKNILKIVLSFYRNKEILTNDEVEIIENFIESNFKFHIVKLNDESIEFFNLKFLYYKNSHNLKYDKYSIFFKYFENIKFENFNVNYFIYSIVLNDEIQSYIIFNDEINIIFKVILNDLLKLNYKTLLDKNLNLTNKDIELLSQIENKKYYYISNDEKIESYENSIKFNLNKIDELIERKNKIERKIKNNIKHNEFLLNKVSILDKRNIKIGNEYFNTTNSFKRNQLEKKLNIINNQIDKLLNEFNESAKRLKNYNKSIEYFENSIKYYENSIEYYENLIEKIEIEIDDFQSTNTFFESVSYFENYDNFEYSYKERKLLDLF